MSRSCWPTQKRGQMLHSRSGNSSEGRFGDSLLFQSACLVWHAASLLLLIAAGVELLGIVVLCVKLRIGMSTSMLALAPKHDRKLPTVEIILKGKVSNMNARKPRRSSHDSAMVPRSTKMVSNTCVKKNP